MRLLFPRLICAASFFLFVECHAQAIATAPAGITVMPTSPTAGLPPAIPTKPALSQQEIDKLISDAHTLYAQGHIPEALAKMQEAAGELQRTGNEEDLASILRDMSLDPNPEYAKVGKRGLAEYFYRKYLASKPRDARWLLEALGWAHYANADDLLKSKFVARVPNKEHENIDARGEQRGKELQADDQLFLAFEDIRQGNSNGLQTRLKNWSYPIDLLHSAQGTSLLHMAVWYQKIDVVKQLVEQYKANINVADKENDSPLDYAYHQKNTEIIKYLTARKARANKNYQQQMFSAPPAPAVKPAVTAPAASDKSAKP